MVPTLATNEQQQPPAVTAPRVSPDRGMDSGIECHRDDESISSGTSSHSGKSSSTQNSSSNQELANQSTSIIDPPTSPLSPPKTEVDILDQVVEDNRDHPPLESSSLLAGPDAPLPDIDLDELCKSHMSVHTLPEEKKSKPSGVSLQDLITGGKASFGLFVKWLKGIPLFTNLPTNDRVSCVKACYIEQLLLTIVYRSLVLQSDGMVMDSGTEFKPDEVKHSLMSYGIGRVVGELMGTFKSLNLDFKEFVCLRLLLLFNPGLY